MSDVGTHFYNKVFFSLMTKNGVHHKKALTYHPKKMDKLRSLIEK